MKFFLRFKSFLRYWLIVKRKRKQLKSTHFSVISSNCIGGVVLHELHCPFNSPFVNLWIEPKDFILLLSNLEMYMNSNLSFIEVSGINYPVGLLAGRIKIYFMHYKSKDDAFSSWERRKSRIVYDNIFVIFTDRDGCTLEDLNHFDNLKYKKVCFTHIKHSNYKSCFYVKGFETESQVGMLMNYRPKSIRTYYDDFDFVAWFNGNENK